MFAFPRWPHISPRNLFSSPFHSRFIFPPKLWIFSDGFLLSELKYRRKLQHQFHRQQRDPPLLPGSLSETRTNRNSPLIQRWPFSWFLSLDKSLHHREEISVWPSSMLLLLFFPILLTSTPFHAQALVFPQ